MDRRRFLLTSLAGVRAGPLTAEAQLRRQWKSGLLEANLAEYGLETGVGAQRIEARLNTENKQGPGVFVIGFLQPCESLFGFAQGGMDNREIVSRNVGELSSLLQILK